MSKGDPWKGYRDFTKARIALGRAGGSLTTEERLAFRRDHALARDAVWSELDTGSLLTQIHEMGYDTMLLRSQAIDREQYIQRPDLGRLLDAESEESLQKQQSGYDISICLVDGLSAMAIAQHALPFLRCLLPLLKGYTIGPLAVVQQGRVAIGDPIGQHNQCQVCVVLIGERPGLTSPYSMGAYMTYSPKGGLTDERRNCISNIRTEGLSYERAAQKLCFLITEAIRRKLSGVDLKDTYEDQLLNYDRTKE
ncbi:ethanolamine ammonia-lyase [Reichenbachiella sp. 5M10]|uniref:ethanolamine ammonia-lyase subunit EutC n=1 Tax=Reichenbachiella sp. 5M10 TaxID=1889772 RepID=UPI000C148BE4|nr:ethanolamine ammonia-lyase subunit EutC [Reichenbachiella sp. 5M10]PIB36930.1 ethanolamine ammonia-lyase [Reichenbachiella sp. 5M10]